MSQRLNDYLAREAGDYLEQLERHLSVPGRPDPELVLRLARGIRGSAQMAGEARVREVGERIEGIARSLQDGTLGWSQEVAGRIDSALGELRTLLGGVAEDRAAPEALASVGSPAVTPAAEDGDDDDVPPVSSLFYDDAGPHEVDSAVAGIPTPSPEAEGEGEVMEIDALLLRGDAALREAIELRSRLEAAVEDPAARELLRELFELVELGRSGRSDTE